MKKVHLIYYHFASTNDHGAAAHIKYTEIHDCILGHLIKTYPQGIWIPNKTVSSLVSKLNLTNPTIGERQQYHVDLMSGYDIQTLDKFLYLENSNFQELMLDLQLYREYHKIAKDETLVLLLDLKNKEMSSHQSIALDSGDLILNTSKLSLEEMIQIIANQTDHA